MTGGEGRASGDIFLGMWGLALWVVYWKWDELMDYMISFISS